MSPQLAGIPRTTPATCIIIRSFFAQAGIRLSFRKSANPKPGDSTLFGLRTLKHLLRLRLVEEFDRCFEDFVFAGGDAGDGGLDADVGLNADALELAAVGVADVHAAESHGNSAGYRCKGDVPVGADGGRSNERNPSLGGFLKSKANPFGCAARLGVD
jgi:hypothetical protein